MNETENIILILKHIFDFEDKELEVLKNNGFRGIDINYILGMDSIYAERIHKIEMRNRKINSLLDDNQKTE